MKNFLKYILKILAVILISFFGIQYFSDSGLRNLKNSIYNDWDNILQGKINADVIVNGSSRGIFGYNCEIIGKELNSSCFNISFNAGGYYLQQSKFDIYMQRNKKPKFIIQNIDLAHFQKNTELPNEEQFTPFINNQSIKSFITKYDPKFFYLGYIPLLKYNQNLKLLKKGITANFSSSIQNENEKTFDGFSPQNRAFKIDYHNLKKIKNYKENIDEKKIRRLVNEMVDFYFERNKDAKVFFVWAPEHKLRCDEAFPLKGKIIVDELNIIKNKNKNF